MEKKETKISNEKNEDLTPNKNKEQKYSKKIVTTKKSLDNTKTPLFKKILPLTKTEKNNLNFHF